MSKKTCTCSTGAKECWCSAAFPPPPLRHYGANVPPDNRPLHDAKLFDMGSDHTIFERSQK